MTPEERAAEIANLTAHFQKFTDLQLIMHTLAYLIIITKPSTQPPEARALWQELIVRTWDETEGSDDDEAPASGA